MFSSEVDVANVALQHIGEPRITSLADGSKAANETAFRIGKVKQAELRRAVYNFATRRMVLRPSATGPFSVSAWVVGTPYAAGDIVTSGSQYWIATAASTGVQPGNTLSGVNPPWILYFGPLRYSAFSTTVQYFPGDIVSSSAVLYVAVAASLNQTPPNTTYWHAPQGLASLPTQLIYPAGYLPSASVTPRTILYLPANYMRLAPQDPKQAGNVRLNVTAGMRYTDWEIENGAIVSQQLTTQLGTTGALIFRFVADVADVTAMDPMFCEAWGARLATEVCIPITQSAEKLKLCQEIYQLKIAEARAVGAVEGGSTEDESPPVQPQQGGR